MPIAKSEEDRWGTMEGTSELALSQTPWFPAMGPSLTRCATSGELPHLSVHKFPQVLR